MSHPPCIVIDSIADDATLSIVGDEARHLGRVLRANPGFKFVGFDGLGNGWLATVSSVTKSLITASVMEKLPHQPPARPAVTVAISPVKGQRMDSAIEKSAELGAVRIIPMSTRFTVVHPGENKLDRWRGIIMAGLKQSRRFRIPELSPVMTLQDVLSLNKNSGMTLALDLDKDALPLTELLDKATDVDNLTLLVGPEGGFSPDEVALFKEMDITTVSLGRHPLRTETAVTVSLGLLNCS